MARDLSKYKFQHNGVDMKKVLHNGTVELWSSSEPFYWIKNGAVQSGYPSNYTNCTFDPKKGEDEDAYVDYNTSLTLCTAYAAGYLAANLRASTAPVETKGNKYIEVTMSPYYAFGTEATSGVLDSFKIGGIECKSKVKNGAVITVDISHLDTVTISVDMTANAWGNTMYNAIQSIRFYSE